MLPLTQLWLPIVLASIIVFFASSVLHMVFTYHNADYKPFANEDEVRALLWKSAPAPGQYQIPHCVDMKQMGSPEMLRKQTEGPNGLFFLRAPGVVKLGPLLGQWFAYTFVVSIFAAYVGVHTIAAGTTYLEVFRVVGTVAFLAYAGSHMQMSIWKGQPWIVTVKDIGDGLIYGLLTAGTFGWLWPRG